MICGLEHSGTTLISELFRQVPELDAGFEVGVLLGRRPRDLPDFDPYFEQMLWGWGLARDALVWCCDTDDFTVFYARLFEAAELKPGTRGIFDKTPRYLLSLDTCLGRVELPFIVAVKDPRATVFSDYRNAGAPDFDTWFETYCVDKLGYMETVYTQWQRARARRDGRVFLLRLEALCLNARATCEAMFAHVGCTFLPAYMALRQVRFAKTRGTSISVGMPFEYVAGLGADRCRRIKSAFADFSDWFYD